MSLRSLIAPFICMLIFAAVPAQSATNDLDIRLISIAGDVRVYTKNHKDEGVPAEEGMPLNPGDRVKTGSDSRAYLGIEGDSVIDIDPGSDFTVASTERKSSAFELTVGSIIAKIKVGLFSDEGVMEIRTPTAVAAVRGTEFAVDHNSSGDNVGVFDEGSVAVRNPYTAGEVLLQRNEETSISNGRPPQTPRVLEHFAARRAAMVALRRRAVRLHSRWRSMPATRRARLRRQTLTRRRALIHRVRTHKGPNPKRGKWIKKKK